MIDSMTVMRDYAGRLAELLAAGGVTGWQVVTDGEAPRVSDARVLELRLVRVSPVVNGLSTYKLDCQLVIRGSADNAAQAEATAADVALIFSVAQTCAQWLPGTDVADKSGVAARYLDTRLDQLASGVISDSLQVAPVGALTLWVYFADE